MVYDNGGVAFCTAGCHPSGAAEALVKHRRFVPDSVLASALACLVTSTAPLRPLCGRFHDLTRWIVVDPMA